MLPVYFSSKNNLEKVSLTRVSLKQRQLLLKSEIEVSSKCLMSKIKHQSCFKAIKTPKS